MLNKEDLPDLGIPWNVLVNRFIDMSLSVAESHRRRLLPTATRLSLMNHDHDDVTPSTAGYHANHPSVGQSINNFLRSQATLQRSNSIGDNEPSDIPPFIPINPHQAQNLQSVETAAEEDRMSPLAPVSRSPGSSRRNNADDDLPGLPSVSDDSSDIDDDMSILNSSRERDEVDDIEMNPILEAVGSTRSYVFDDMPPLEPVQPRSPPSPARTSTRRARVDDEEENDHMPPPPAAQFAAVGAPPQNATASASGSRRDRFTRPPQSFVSTQPLSHQQNPLFGASGIGRPPFDARSLFSQVFRNSRSPGSAPPNDNTNSLPPFVNTPGMTFNFNADGSAGDPHSNAHPPGHPPPGFIDITMGIFGIPPPGTVLPSPQNAQQTQDQGRPQGPVPPAFEDMVRAMLGGMLPTAFGMGLEPEVEDPERAKRLIAGLEVVPQGLVKRLERVGGAPGAHEDDSGVGDAGCAVCWDKLSGAEGGWLKPSGSLNSEAAGGNESGNNSNADVASSTDVTTNSHGQGKYCMI